MAWAAALVEARGADRVDVNLGCPIEHFTSKGLGAALARQPKRIGRIVDAMKKAVTRVPVTVKIRIGWNDEMRNYLDQARAAVDGGADAVFVHGQQARVGDGHSMSIAGKISQHGSRPGEWAFGIDHPFAFAQRHKPFGEGGGLG